MLSSRFQKTVWSIILFALAVTPNAAAAENEISGMTSNDQADFAFARETWTGDLSGILERTLLRVGTVYSPIFLIYDGLEQSGISVESSNELKKHLQEHLGDQAEDLTVLVVPLARNDLIPALVEGRVDLLMANLTITTKRSELVSFSNPVLSDVRELLVTGPSAGEVASFDDLQPIGIHLRPSSSYADSLNELNAARNADGLPEIPLIESDERLEDYDLLEMVAAGAIPAVVVDSHKAALWEQVYEEINVHKDLFLRNGGETGLAVRKDSPELLEALNMFVDVAKKGTLLGNILFERYYGDKDRMVDALNPGTTARLDEVYKIIRKHATKYDFEPLLIAAQGFQESRLDQSKKSPAGAIGIMQILPDTAKDPNVGIPDVHLTDQNIEAGVKYLRFLRDRYFSAPEITSENAAFLTFASYNAGPRKIAMARSEAEKMGLDPNVWFGNVEIASARIISREPVVYVRNILKYYSQYRAYNKLSEAASAQ